MTVAVVHLVRHPTRVGGPSLELCLVPSCVCVLLFVTQTLLDNNTQLPEGAIGPIAADSSTLVASSDELLARDSSESEGDPVARRIAFLERNIIAYEEVR